MRSVPTAAAADPLLAGPDLTRYVLVCVLSIGALLACAWAFRRFLAERLRARAALRSLRVVDVLPLSGKQRLVVVRCYERSFLLGLGEKDVRLIAELDESAEPAGSAAKRGNAAPERSTRPAGSFPAAFADELDALAPRPRAAAAHADQERGILA